MTLQIAISAAHQLDVTELAQLKAVVAMRLESLTRGQTVPDNWWKRWWQRLTQPHHYARARDRENLRLLEQNQRLIRELRRLRSG